MKSFRRMIFLENSFFMVLTNPWNWSDYSFKLSKSEMAWKIWLGSDFFKFNILM